MVLTRATQRRPGADGVLGTADDVDEAHEHRRRPFVDQNQTYTSHPSHQVFLREYELNGAGEPVATGRLIDEPRPGSTAFRHADVETAAWRPGPTSRPRRATMLGIQLTDADVVNVPLLATDAYGKFIPRRRTASRSSSLTRRRWHPDTADDVLVEGNVRARRSACRRGAHRPRVPRRHRAQRRARHRAERRCQRRRGTPTLRTTAAVDRRPIATDYNRHLRQRAARRALHHRRRPRQREHRPDRRPPRLPLRAQPAGRAHASRSRSHQAT